MVPGIVPAGTLLYHGRGIPVIPTEPDWVATDIEHAYLFCHSFSPLPPRRNVTSGSGSDCWFLTVVAKRPLKVLYFDGSSAAKMKDGPIDTQDVITWQQIMPDRYFAEVERIESLCEWGKRFGIDGFVRCAILSGLHQ